MERGSYKTKARNILSEEIKEFSNGFTIKELKAKLDNKNINIGLTTIYRTLEYFCIPNPTEGMHPVFRTHGTARGFRVRQYIFV